MKDSTIIIHADVYSEEIPRTPDSVMTSSDSPSPPPPASTSFISSTGYDTPDEARHGKHSPPSTLTPTTPVSGKPLISHENSDAELIEEAVPIIKTTLPVPEPQPKIERNGVDHETMHFTSPNKKMQDHANEDTCLINCIYYSQQCCECTIL